MSGPEIKLLSVEASDIPTLAKINEIGFADQAIDKLMFPKSDGGLLASHMLKIFSEDSTARFMKAVIDGQIVGFTQWHHYHDFPLPAEAEPLPNWGPDANGVLCNVFFGAMKRVRREHMAGKKCSGKYSCLLIKKETAKVRVLLFQFFRFWSPFRNFREEELVPFFFKMDYVWQTKQVYRRGWRRPQKDVDFTGN